MLNALEEHSDLLDNFATDRLDEDNILSAEKFIVKVVDSKSCKATRHLMTSD